MSKSKLRISKTHQPEQEEEEEREISPIERRRRLIINVGVAIVILAFSVTSGITYTNLNQEVPVDNPTQQEAPMDQVQMEIERWQGELANDPQNVAALANLGFYYRQKALPLLVDEKKKEESQQLLARSEENLRKAMELDPNYGFAVQELASTLRMQEKDDEARQLLEKAIEQAQQPVQPAQGEDPETLKAARQRQEVEARMALADLAFSQGNTEEVLAQLGKVLELEPGNIDAYMGRASLYQRDEKKDLAKADLEKALDIAQKMNDRRAVLIMQLLYQMDNPVSATPVPGGTPGAEAPMPIPMTSPGAEAPLPTASPGAEAPIPTATPAAEATPASPGR
ncbi:MAG: hypothetical protein HY319_14425 [Armatimonadetes bacterium]|nr:hypothetical protein [Armatimonadota bacterium]